MMRRAWTVVGALGLLFVLGFSVYLGAQRANQTKLPPLAEPATVAVERGPLSLTVTAPGKLVSTNSPTLYMQASGTIAEIPIRPGDRVQAGETLVRLSNPEMLNADLAVQIADAQQGLAEARAEQHKAQAARAAMEYPHSTDPFIIEQAWVHYELARREHTRALKAYEKVKNRPRLNEARIQALDALISAEMAMDEALALYNWYTGFATETQIAQADARITVAEAAVWQAETELAALQEQEAGHVLSAPADGVVLDVLVEPGQAVGLETAAIVFADPLALEGWTTVIEEDIRLVQIGQTAELYIDALPEVSMTGTVTRILPRRIADEDRPLYYVILELGEIPGELFDGMNLDAAIVIDTRDDVLRLPRSVIRSAANGDPMVLVWENGQEIERLVEVGLQGDLYVEILDGLSEGEQVIAR